MVMATFVSESFLYVIVSLSSGHENCTFHHDLELDHRPPTREALLPDMANSYRLLLTGKFSSSLNSFTVLVESLLLVYYLRDFW